MKGSYIGEFEELVLLMVSINSENAYMMNIREELFTQVGRKVSMGALHITLSRLEKKGLLSSEMGGASSRRGGRRKRIYTVTATGEKVLMEIRNTRMQLWSQIPSLSPNIGHA